MSEKQNKYAFWKEQKSRELNDERLRIKQDYKNRKINSIYNLWMTKYNWNGFDEEVKERQENFVMRKFWSEGTVAVRKDNVGMFVFTPYNITSYDLYDFPSEVTLVNKRGVSKVLIPEDTQTVNKDVVLMWCMPNHKSINYMVDYYVDRMAQVEMILNNNLTLQSMPYVIGCTEEDKEQLQDIVDKILNNELVVFTEVGDISKLQALITQVPYLADKLRQHQVSLENEIYTLLGINNSGVQQKKAQMLVDEVNSNNDSIDDFSNAITNEIQKGLDQVKRVLGKEITIEEVEPCVDTEEDFEDASIDKQEEDE